jgi:hypothetical protein
MRTRKLFCHAVGAAVVACTFAVGCAAPAGDEAQNMDTLPASEQTIARTGVTRWTTHEDPSGRWVLGFADGDTPVARLHVEPIGDDALRITRDPEGDELRLSRDGVVDGGATDQARALVAALYADAKAAPLSPALGGDPQTLAPGIGTTQQALTSINSLQDFARGGWFGSDETLDAGWGCGGALRSSYDTYMVAGPPTAGTCAIERWLSDDPTDCRVRLRIRVTAWFTQITCRTIVYVDR